MAPKLPLPSSKITRGAAMLLIAALQDERVRAQLGKAPTAARDWASANRGIERRLAAVQRNADIVFPSRSDPRGAGVHRSIDELSQANEITATMPLAERRRAQGRIKTELARIELVLVDAVLPADRPSLGSG
ncbi:MAG TPA: hypothetical protein VES40_07565 [Ilumatobacteraceae bacterium]|nr:hypothetical protein [Ilumatobacteraceae bacterium]